MPRPMHGKPEKSKDFVGSMKKLLKSLKTWKIVLFLSLFLAMIGAILSLISPNKLSDLTDVITKGISPNTTNIEKISIKIFKNFNKDNLIEKTPIILSSNNISSEDKQKFNYILNNISKTKNRDEIIKQVTLIPEDILNILLEDITFNKKVITTSDQIELLNLYNKDKKNVLKEIDKLPKNIYNLIKPSINMNKIKEIATFIILLYLTSALFSYIQSLIMASISNNYAKELRLKVSKKINKLPLKYFDSHETGDILSRITNDIDTISHNLNNSLSSLVTSITLFIGSIIMMFITNWIMAITAIVSSLIGFSVMFLILGKSQKYFNKRQEQLGEINGYIEEIYSGHNVVKVYNGVEKALEEFNEMNENLYESNMKSQFLSGLMMPIMGFVGNLGYVAVCLVGALLVSNDVITFGVIVAFMVYVRLFVNPLSQIGQAATSLQSTAAAGERVFEFLEEKEMSSQNNIKQFLDKTKVKGNIEFKNVKFGYSTGKTIIKDFSVKVKPGQKVAIVGPTGAGKTTIVNLLMKFYEIKSGDILIDGVSINDLSRENIHDLFCMVLQDTWLFEGTILDNIKFNNANVSERQIWSACKTVGVDHFIKTLPGGLSSEVSDNDTVSSGQKQLFTIARGMIESSPFLILDEATSNVDTRTEELVQKAMDKLTEGKTSFIIAHRLSTIKNADIILVMKDGNIIEQGNHDELMNKDGFYAELYNSQFEL